MQDTKTYIGFFLNKSPSPFDTGCGYIYIYILTTSSNPWDSALALHKPAMGKKTRTGTGGRRTILQLSPPRSGTGGGREDALGSEGKNTIIFYVLVYGWWMIRSKSGPFFY